MANPEHLAVLRQGAKAWNEWRAKYPELRPDLSYANLGGTDRGETKLTGVDLIKASISVPNLMDANLSGANLAGANLTRANLRRANLIRADLESARLIRANLEEGDLRGAQLRRADLSGADLVWADLSAADLSHSRLSLANLNGADLRGATFNGAQLEGATFSGSIVDSTLLLNLDLGQVYGLDTVEHRGPSSIGIDTIYRSRGKIPETFLRGAGVPEPFVANMKSLVAAVSPIEFYSCFISYSSKDQEFAERLHADLRSKNVRCWFAPKDLKIGDRLRPSFDEAIRVHDKLMVVLSENSVTSKWVEKEVETAFEKENRDKNRRTVLFPIRLDNAVMETDEAWAADIRRTRHIGDFREWKNHDTYKKAFERLLRDLKA